MTKKFELEPTKNEHRTWLAEACAKFEANGGKVTVVPRGKSGLPGGVSNKAWEEILQTPGKTNLRQVELDREAQVLREELAHLQRELRKLERRERGK